ncbi:hypothetical protein BC827DRAFT_756849 [Russula dissimulans]|nr:hypothetical protein BC827DRAFT_756849 [Russula dissimulans]
MTCHAVSTRLFGTKRRALFYFSFPPENDFSNQVFLSSRSRVLFDFSTRTRSYESKKVSGGDVVRNPLHVFHPEFCCCVGHSYTALSCTQNLKQGQFLNPDKSVRDNPVLTSASDLENVSALRHFNQRSNLRDPRFRTVQSVRASFLAVGRSCVLQ